MNPKVLIGVVTYVGKDYIFDEFWKNIQNLDYDNYDVVVVDNTKGKKYYSKLKRRGIPVHHVNRGANSRMAQDRSLNKITSIMLKGDYEYFLSIESDLLPPSDIIQRLMAHDKDVVGCMYNIGYVDSASQPPRPCLFTMNKEEINGKATRNLTADEGFSLFGRGVIRIHGCGLGTTLIRRSIVEEVPFRYTTENDRVHSDAVFYGDLHNKKIQAFVDTDIIIPHFNSDWNLVKDY